MLRQVASAVLTYKNLYKGVPLQLLKRHGHAWVYRSPPVAAPKSHLIASEIVGGFMWWWILWHLWHEYEHITGEYPYPDPSLWTDEELGIPTEEEI
ncbi:NADH dehydrogenase [ubiquinone] 1 beta subcomplex subunit 2, mitochondrial-like [Limulus polyphemus]|uniref:NADH dehydrogenase [ubiquinone] 1 beta subcomplex subunit 2, mitochondrial-like n=1 Tax=Limulus polyphemus TaxID=6850 RepID=A0ABM1B3Z0_LIMPO|nr:NADH dehydrogenase [ubiquinone] 1 beta subcomplex subunit 2, mitochondrial-like [Limulus polyphemus]